MGAVLCRLLYKPSAYLSRWDHFQWKWVERNFDSDSSGSCGCLKSRSTPNVSKFYVQCMFHINSAGVQDWHSLILRGENKCKSICCGLFCWISPFFSQIDARAFAGVFSVVVVVWPWVLACRCLEAWPLWLAELGSGKATAISNFLPAS